MECVVGSLLDAVDQVEVKEFDQLLNVGGCHPWIEDRDDFVITLSMVAYPLPRNQPRLVLARSSGHFRATYARLLSSARPSGRIGTTLS
jgi:hypothetical protein